MSAKLLAGMAWRRAIKKYSPGKAPAKKIESVLEAARLAPTSFGVQPFHIHVVTNQDMKKKLREASYNQPQVEECSHLLVFTARLDASGATERFIKAKDLDNKDVALAKVLRESVAVKNPVDFREWSISQAFIAFGFSTAAAADLRLGACPMGGFIPTAVQKVLQLSDNELPVAYLAIGKAPPDDPEDPIQKQANPFGKLRMDIKDIANWVN